MIFYMYMNMDLSMVMFFDGFLAAWDLLPLLRMFGGKHPPILSDKNAQLLMSSASTSCP